MSLSPRSRRSRPTSAPSLEDPPSSPINMQRSSSADQKGSRRKGPRSVSTLTPAQLARKRANDREAQRAIRARTKDHIERLEAEIEELKTASNRDRTIRELLRRNKALEDELSSLRESMGISLTHTSPYSGQVFDDNMSTRSGAIATSPRTSPYPAGDFGAAASAPLADYTSGYVPFTNANPSCDSWTANIPTSVASNVSSPCSSAATDDYVTGPAYLPTSAPNPMVPSPSTSGLRTQENIKMEYDDTNDRGFHLEGRSTPSSAAPTPPIPAMGPAFMLRQQQQQQQPQQQHAAPWDAFAPMYYAPLQQPPVH